MLAFRSANPREQEEARLRPEIVKMNNQAPEASLVTYAAEKIRAGEVLGVPTDTFLWPGRRPFQPACGRPGLRNQDPLAPQAVVAVDRVGRPGGGHGRAGPGDFLSAGATLLAGTTDDHRQGRSKLPLKVTANTGNVALRVPAAEIPLAIIRSAGLPITATSANLHGEVECTTAMQVRDQLGDCLSIIVDGGQVPGVMPSTIVDLTGDVSWRLLRQGAIPEEQIVELLGGRE